MFKTYALNKQVRNNLLCKNSLLLATTSLNVWNSGDQVGSISFCRRCLQRDVNRRKLAFLIGCQNGEQNKNKIDLFNAESSDSFTEFKESGSHK